MATNEQISEIEEIIAKAREVKDPMSKDAHDLYNKAIRLTDEYFKLDRPEEEIGEPTYDPKKNEGAHAGLTVPVNKDGKAKAETTLGPAAFVNNGKPDARWLAAVKVHEYAHAAVGVELHEFTAKEIEQLKKAGPPWSDEDIKKARFAQFKPQDVNEEEVIAYDTMLKKAGELGLAPSDVEWIKQQKKSFYEKMSEDKKKQYKAKEPWLGCRIPEFELNEGLGVFVVPKDTVVTFDPGSSWALPCAMTVYELTNIRFEGNYRKLFNLNPHLSIEVAALQTLLFGPGIRLPEVQAIEASVMVLLNSPAFFADGSVVNGLAGAIETPCASGIVRVRHAYSECQADRFWHIVEDDYVSCPPGGQIKKYRVFDLTTIQSCKNGEALPQPVGVAYKDLHGDSTCQAPKEIGDIIISECFNGFWENATYGLYECIDGTRRVSVPAKTREKTNVPCSSTPVVIP